MRGKFKQLARGAWQPIGRAIDRLLHGPRHRDPAGKGTDRCASCKKTAIVSDNAPNDQLTWCSYCERFYCPCDCFTRHMDSK